ncbi:hypothetical protein TNCV_766781 [Trichonephila clavipes]|nr:hypothetical protein TNCV_766781 [Trichonephila clavipes]
MTGTTSELAPPLLTTTPHQWEDVSALDRFNVYRSLTRRVFGGTGLEIKTCQPRSNPLTTGLPRPPSFSGVNYFRATRGLLATDHVILNHGQVTWTTPELAPPLLTTTPTGRKSRERSYVCNDEPKPSEPDVFNPLYLHPNSSNS